MPKEQFNKELDRVFIECSEKDWDGHRASPITQETLNYAKKFAKQIPEDIPDPDVGAAPDGSISFEWYRSNEKLVSVSIYPDGGYRFAYIVFAEKKYGTDFVVTDDFCNVIRKALKDENGTI